MADRAPRPETYKPRHHRGWRRNRDRRRWAAGGSLEGMLAAIPSMPRPALARLVQQAIDRMDDLDGDPDLEPCGDELDGNDAEDEELALSAMQFRLDQQRGPGCSVADPGGDVAYAEQANLAQRMIVPRMNGAPVARCFL